MTDWLERQYRLIGDEASRRLAAARVAVIGLGGVGGAAMEALARCGCGHLLVMDGDCFDATNLNRQILATRQTLGQSKSAAAAARVAVINPEAEVTAVQDRFCARTATVLTGFCPDYVVDAIDSVADKLDLIELCARGGIPIISSMGTGNRLLADFRIGPIEETAGCGCPLARVMRRELKRRGIAGVTVLYGASPPEEPAEPSRVPASIAFVPPVAGYLIAGHVARQMIERQ